MKLTAEARRARILELLDDGSHATIRELAEGVGETPASVRSACYALENAGAILIGQDESKILHVSLPGARDTTAVVPGETVLDFRVRAFAESLAAGDFGRAARFADAVLCTETLSDA